jgi:ribosomal protein L18
LDLATRFQGEKTKKSTIIAIVLAFVAIIAGVTVWMSYKQPTDESRHETTRWALIEDSNSDHLAVETTSDEVWSQLLQLNQNGSRLWIGGIVESYNNSWGFRFKPESLRTAEVTAEGLQATIRYISENLNVWLGQWAYVNGKVTEIHLPT